MADIKDKTIADRRDFLKLAGIAAAGSAVAVLSSAKEAKALTETEAETGSSGYRETDHVKKYYELAGF